MINDPDKSDFDDLLNVLDEPVAMARLQQVRRQILTKITARQRFFLFGWTSEPAMLFATALVGLIMGLSFSVPVFNDNAPTLLDAQTQSFIEGDTR